jgi:hypothetical protein
MILDFTKKNFNKKIHQMFFFVAAILYIKACLIRPGIVIQKLPGS